MSTGCSPCSPEPSAQGRLGTVAGTILLPWVATSALGIWSHDDDRRWRSVWRTALGGALLTAFVPAAWLLGLLVALGAIVVGANRDPARWRTLNWWTAPLAVVVAIPLLLLPWVVGVAATPGSWLVEAGRVGVVPSLPSAFDLATVRAGGPDNAPTWIGAGLLVAGLLSVFRAEVRSKVLAAWGVAALAAFMLALTSRAPSTCRAIDGRFRVWSGFLLVVVHGALVSAAVLAGDGLRGADPGRRVRLAAPVAALWAAAAPRSRSSGHRVVGGRRCRRPPRARPRSSVPSLHGRAVRAPTTPTGVLLLRGDLGPGSTYQVLRDGALHAR